MWTVTVYDSLTKTTACKQACIYEVIRQSSKEMNASPNSDNSNREA